MVVLNVITGCEASLANDGESLGAVIVTGNRWARFVTYPAELEAFTSTRYDPGF